MLRRTTHTLPGHVYNECAAVPATERSELSRGEGPVSRPGVNGLGGLDVGLSE
jgi:hypothetical protein